MILRWFNHVLWHPAQRWCRANPVVPMEITISEPVEGVTAIRIDNWLVRLLSKIAGFDYSQSYLIDGEVLIDTGFSWSKSGLRKALVNLGADKTIKIVVNTHYHEDHVGNNDLLADLCQPKIYAHPLAISDIRYPRENAWYRGFLFGPAGGYEVAVAPAIISTRRFQLQVHHLPGHCPGHICLFEPNQRWLFSGDLYIAPDLDTQLADADGPAWIESLEKAIALRPRCMFDAHGSVFLNEDKVIALLTRKLEFLLALKKQVLAAADHAQTLQEITRKVFQKNNLTDRLSFSDGWLSLITGADFSRANLVRSFIYESVLEEVALHSKLQDPPRHSATA